MFSRGIQWMNQNKVSMTHVSINNKGLNLYGEYFNFGFKKAVIIIAGRTYRVKGTVLVEPEPEQEAPAIPARPDMHRRKDLAGQVVRQTTKCGLYDVTYNEDGYAVKASRVN